MTVTSREIGGSRDGTDSFDRDSSAELLWMVKGTNDTAELRAHMIGVVPLEYDNLVLRSTSWEWKAPKKWHFRAAYIEASVADELKQLDVGEYRVTFDTTGGTTHIKAVSALLQRGYAKPGESAPDLRGALNVRWNGTELTAEGADIAIPALKFTIHFRQSLGTITRAYVVALARLTGKVNNKPFWGFEAGEVLFMGATGQQGSKGDPEIDYHFVASENISSLQIGQIPGIVKKGHEHLAVLFEHEDVPNDLVCVPRAAYVSEVATPRDFDSLKIGA